jgi:hypothetical protein
MFWVIVAVVAVAVIASLVWWAKRRRTGKA